MIMGLLANYPVGLAPSLGVTALFSSTLCGRMGYSWQAGLCAVFLVGIIMLLIAVTGIRTAILRSIPAHLKNAISAGIGFFLTFVGLKNCGIIVNSEQNYVALGKIFSAEVLVSLFGIIIMLALIIKWKKFPMIFGMLGTTVIGLIVGFFSDNPGLPRIPESFFVNLELPEFSGSMIKTKFPLSLSFSYSDKYFLISSSQNAGINGIFDLNNKLLDLTVNNGSFISFGLGGITSANNTSLSLYDINIDLAKLFSYLNFDNILSVENGIINGDIMISNSLDNPDFSGSIRIPKPVFRLPFLTNHKLTTDELVLNFNQNEIEFEKTVLKNKNNKKVEVEFDFMLNKWMIDRIEGSVKTQNPNLFPIKITTPLFVLQGNVFTDLKLSFEENIFDISGTIFGEDIDLNSSVSSFTGIPQNQLNELQNNSESIQVQTNLDIKLGTHASISFDPILRCVFVPNTSFSLIYNPDNEQLSVDGELKVRSGDVSYLNRNFYIKSGAIKFNPEELSNPIVTFRAETREKDFKGQTVKIIMSVENQYLDKMEPRFSSEPAKSENDILTMLGQIVVADSNKATDFLFAASDYALQSTVMRSMENKLRDLLNFDIFSIRTNILQNTLGMGMSGDLSKNNISIGNFLDNSTVYVGRYLGSSLYIDAMLHVSFDNTNTSDIFSVRKTNFQPEFGIELEGPLSNVPIKINSGTEFLFSGPNIRINMAPDINAMINGRFEPATSLTLTWKLTF